MLLSLWSWEFGPPNGWVHLFVRARRPPAEVLPQPCAECAGIEGCWLRLQAVHLISLVLPCHHGCCPAILHPGRGTAGSKLPAPAHLHTPPRRCLVPHSAATASGPPTGRCRRWEMPTHPWTRWVLCAFKLFCVNCGPCAVACAQRHRAVCGAAVQSRGRPSSPAAHGLQWYGP